MFVNDAGELLGVVLHIDPLDKVVLGLQIIRPGEVQVVAAQHEGVHLLGDYEADGIEEDIYRAGLFERTERALLDYLWVGQLVEVYNDVEGLAEHGQFLVALVAVLALLAVPEVRLAQRSFDTLMSQLDIRVFLDASRLAEQPLWDLYHGRVDQDINGILRSSSHHYIHSVYLNVHLGYFHRLTEIGLLG